MGFRGFVTAIEFSPDGRHVATLEYRRHMTESVPGPVLRVWQFHDLRGRGTHESRRRRARAKFSLDSREIASASRDGTARVWTVASGGERMRITHNATVNSVAFDRDGSLLDTCGDDGTVGVWRRA
jgi:WD40 repeat protein